MTTKIDIISLIDALESTTVRRSKKKEDCQRRTNTVGKLLSSFADFF
jgi:hypothetical protein